MCKREKEEEGKREQKKRNRKIAHPLTTNNFPAQFKRMFPPSSKDYPCSCNPNNLFRNLHIRFLHMACIEVMVLGRPILLQDVDQRDLERFDLFVYLVRVVVSCLE